MLSINIYVRNEKNQLMFLKEKEKNPFHYFLISFSLSFTYKISLPSSFFLLLLHLAFSIFDSVLPPSCTQSIKKSHKI